MDTYIALLLLVVPGFIAQHFYEALNQNKKDDSDFQATVKALVFSAAILVINYFIISKFRKAYSLVELQEKFKSITFVLKYSGLTVVISFLVAILWNFIHPSFTYSVINFFRKAQKKNEIELGCSWDKLFNDGENHAIEIYKDNLLIARGFTKYTSSSDNSVKEMYLVDEDLMDNYKALLDVIAGVYVDFDRGITIKEFSLEKLNSEIESKLKEKK